VQIKQAHELTGRIALAQKDYDTAIAELQQANQQNPRNLFRLGQAYEGKGDSVKAHEFYVQSAEFYPLPQLPYAFIRVKAQKSREARKLDKMFPAITPRQAFATPGQFRELRLAEK
jgi:tetratricopeptide (TPR) repeat protein